VVDLCHGIRPQAIAEAAFWLERCYPWFPRGSVHLAVVDPGVGSERRLLAAAIDGHLFLAPDNGLLGERLLAADGAEIRAIEVDRLGLATPSATFHGRDVFAPIAAGLASRALTFTSLGPTIEPLPCVLGAARLTGDRVHGEVVTVDRFGNLLTNLDPGAWRGRAVSQVMVASRSIVLGRTYSDAPTGALLALVNSFGVLEIALPGGSAEQHLGLGRGTPVELTLAAGARVPD